jgi:carboxynorspermidine decarboxylase
MGELPEGITTPYHVVDIDQLNKNLSILFTLKQKTKCKIIYALKCFSNNLLFPYISKVLDGVCASGLFEARLGKELFGKEVHTFSSAFSRSNIHEISKYSDFMTFNSISQWNNFKSIADMYNCVSGLRLNPNYSEINNYNINPCHEYTRFGVTEHEIDKVNLNELIFVLIHNMCGQFSDTLYRSIEIIVKKFDKYFFSVKHINLGGGQLFTSCKYHLQDAILSLDEFQNRYKITVYFEPGEAIIYNTAYLVTTIVDIIDNGIKTVILDASALCHLPDVVFSKFRHEVVNGFLPFQQPYTYRIAGSSCYAGDIFGDYSFSEPFAIGDKIIFQDSLNYTMVKGNMFNGIPCPSIVSFSLNSGYQLMKKYTYETFLSNI